MRNLNLDQIQTLIAIADLGTFAAASQAPSGAAHDQPASRNWRRACGSTGAARPAQAD